MKKRVCTKLLKAHKIIKKKNGFLKQAKTNTREF